MRYPCGSEDPYLSMEATAFEPENMRAKHVISATAFASASVVKPYSFASLYKNVSRKSSLRWTRFCPEFTQVQGERRFRADLPFRRYFRQSSIQATDRSELKEGSTVGFCTRQRQHKAKEGSSYVVSKSTIKKSHWKDMPAITAELNSRCGKRNPLSLAVILLRNGLMRVAMSDAIELEYQRYVVGDVVLDDVASSVVDSMVLTVENNYAQVSAKENGTALKVWFDPFRLEVIDDKLEQTIMTVNQDSRLLMEAFHENVNNDVENADSLVRGAESVGVDIAFPAANRLHGIPERTSPFSLTKTIGDDGAVCSEPYRFYNLDITFYELQDPIGLYGSVPMLYAREEDRAVGLFWHNASETFMDLQKSTSQSAVMSTHWYSESGLIDFFILPGPSPNDVFKKYLSLTGHSQLPPLFSLGYHQCRYSYQDEEDVRNVEAGFATRQIPYDVMWLDIDHTDGKRYFTWDKQKFPDPVKLQEYLAECGRKTVAIIDPHIKTDPDYDLHARASAERLYVRNPDGSDFEGDCWAGSSSYLDFLSPRVREEWAGRFNSTKYPGMTEHLHVWNDMNEPAVFDGPNGTLPKDVLHGENEHRHVHNIYGHCMTKATYEGLVKNWPNRRGFLLTRSFFAGTQRYSAVWTGDNGVSWDHLRATIGMLNSLEICGMAMSGADIGGFLGNPDGELATRWYQAAAFQPFFRGHSDKGTKRREPWTFGEPFTGLIAEAIRTRYEFIPYWYSLFAGVTGTGCIENDGPPMRPVWWHFPGWEAEDSAWMVGSALLVAPVLRGGVHEHVVELPKGRWYDIFDGGREKQGRAAIEAKLERMAVFLRGGEIVTRLQDKRVQSCADLITWRYAMTVGLDENMCAEGMGYFDDGESFDFRKGAFRTRRLRFTGDELTVESVAGEFTQGGLVETVSVYGFQGGPPAKVLVSTKSGKREVAFSHDADKRVVVVSGIGECMVEGDWRIRFER